MIELCVKLFFLLTPFFVLSLFVNVTHNKTIKEKKLIAIKTSIWILIVCLIVLFFGSQLFSILGITLPAFQLGSGIILLLSGIKMVNTNNSINIDSRTTDPIVNNDNNNDDDPSLIPLTLPVTVGPGTVGALMVMGANLTAHTILINVISICLAVLAIFILLYFSHIFENILKKNGLTVLTKLTGLFLACLAMQSILNGLQHFF